MAFRSLSIDPLRPSVLRVVVFKVNPNSAAASFASSEGFRKARNTPLIEVIASSVLIPALVKVAIIAPNSSKLNPDLAAIAADFPIAGANSLKVNFPRLTIANNLSETSPALSADIP
ncbi:hypothetical protein ES708_32309 [subsurface metagenome]